MSLVNNSDLIIPNTVGIISAAAREANGHQDKYREHRLQEDAKAKDMAEYIREMQQIHPILQGRVDGIPLDHLVNPSRIASNGTRSISKEEALQEYELGQAQDKNANNGRAYEDWFRG